MKLPITGNSATYNVDDNKLIITENVVLKNQLSMINGNKLILDINSGKIEILMISLTKRSHAGRSRR